MRRPTWASRCSRSARRSARCSPATPSATGSARTARTTKSTCSCRETGRQLASDLGNLYLTTNKRGPDGELRMVPLRQVAEIVETTSPQIIKRQDLQRRVGALRQRRGPAVGRRRRRRAEDRRRRPSCRRATASTSAASAGHAGVVPGGAGGARARDDLHLPDPRLAVRELPAAARDHGVAAVLADRRVPGAAAHGHDAQHLLDHRLHHADGPGDQERDPAGRLRQPRAPRAARALHDALLARRARCGCGRS